LAQALRQRSYPNLSLSYELFAGKSHFNVLTEIIHGGLETCWSIHREG
jgi:hypothetical protein